MTRSSSIDEARAFHPLLVESQYRILWCTEQLRREATAAGLGGKLLELLWTTVQRDPLHAPPEWVHLMRVRAERAGALRTAQIAAHYETLLSNVESMLRGRRDVPDRIRRSSELLELLERRSSARAPVEIPLAWTAAAGEEQGICRNLSDGGMLVELEHPSSVGTLALVRLGIDPPLGPLHVRARVVWAAADDPHRPPLVGCQFAHTAREATHRIRLMVRRVTGQSDG